MPPRDTRLLLRPGRLLDVASGALRARQAVLVVGDRVAAVGDAGDVDATGADVVELPDLTLLPGLVDCHTHLVGEVDGGHGYADLVTRSAAQEAMTGVRNARATLEAGFTTVRDVGTFRALVDVALRDAIDAGWTPGPRMHCAGAYVTCAGGGGDVTGLAVDVDAVVPRDLRYGVAETADEVRAAVRRVLRAGADLVKVIGTGAVLTEGTVPGAPEYTEAEIRAAVKEAAHYGAHVAVHAHGAEGVARAARAGARSVEHGSLADDAALALMKQHGTYLVADVYCGDWIAEQGRAQGWSTEVLRKNDETTQTQREAFRKAVALGVPIAFGTDSGVYPHGRNARQFAYQVRCGQSPLEAIRSATLWAAELLGRSDVGRVQAGAFADLVGVAGDPTDDVRLLEDVRWVMKGGQLVRSG